MLELLDLDCIRGERQLFQGIRAALEPGTLMRVHGANGAGKTSLLRMICGLTMPARGEVRWSGVPVTSLKEEYGRQLVYLGHAAALKEDLSALENLASSAALAGLAFRHQDALAALASAGLAGREHLPVRVLSQGQKRRAGLARLRLSGSVPLWVLDEPFSALDAGAIEWLRTVLAEHLQRSGMLVLSSHQPVDVGAGARHVDLYL